MKVSFCRFQLRQEPLRFQLRQEPLREPLLGSAVGDHTHDPNDQESDADARYGQNTFLIQLLSFWKTGQVVDDKVQRLGSASFLSLAIRQEGGRRSSVVTLYVMTTTLAVTQV